MPGKGKAYLRLDSSEVDWRTVVLACPEHQRQSLHKVSEKQSLSYLNEAQTSAR